MKINKMIICIILLCVASLSIGFSAFGTELSISNVVAEVKIEKDVRITGVELISEQSSNVAPNDLNYDADSVVANVAFNDLTSYITYNITITNIGNSEVGISNINIPEGIEYELTNYNLKDKICDSSNKCSLGINKTFSIKIYPTSKTGLNQNKIKVDLTFLPFHTITYSNIESSDNYPTNILEGEELKILFLVPPKFINIYINGTEIDKNKYIYQDGMLSINNVNGNMIIEKGESVLIPGEEFSKSLKDFVNNTTDATYKSEDYTIKYIGFYENTLPEGYTKDKLEELPYISVSSDNNIKAYNDNGNIYVYSKHDIKAGTSIYSMFREMKNLEEVDLSVIETENVKDMRSLFNNSTKIKKIDVSHFDTSNATQMGSIFKNLSLITDLDLTNWNTSKSIRFDEMFSGCTNIKELNLTSFDTSKLTMSYRMFYGMTNLEHIYVGDKWNLSTLENLGYKGEEFYNCTKLPNFNSKNIDYTKAYVGEGGYLSYLPE